MCIYYVECVGKNLWTPLCVMRLEIIIIELIYVQYVLYRRERKLDI